MFSAFSKKIPYLTLISSLCRSRNTAVWLVGGFLRDIYLNPEKELLDFDFCVEKNTLSLVREFARKISSRFIVLDKKQGSYRVILKKKGRVYTYDFTRLRGKNLKEDLRLRDFTVNTLTVSLSERKPEITDHFKARQDIKKRIVKISQEAVLLDDPLRILRGFSLVANHNFHIVPKTLQLMVKHKHLLRSVSRERVNEELFKILASFDSYPVLKLMDKLKIIDEFIPEITPMRGVTQGGYHHLAVWGHSLETLRQFELLLRRRFIKNESFLSYLNQELAGQRRRAQIIKLACLLHDIGKPLAKKRLKNKTIFHTHEKIGRDLAGKVADSLKLSWREKESLRKLIFWHLRPGYLADQINPSQRAVYRFFRDTQQEGPAVIFLSLADWRATRGPLTNAKKRKRHETIMLKLADKYFTDAKKKPLPKIIDGHGIMKKFKITPGPLVGVVLKKVKEEQALGRISTKRQALKAAGEIINKR